MRIVMTLLPPIHMSMTAFRLGAMVALLCAARGVEAQQACPSATPSAIRSIDGLLQSAKERPWLAAHGITASQTSALSALVDSIDAGRCQQIAGMLTRQPAYFFRAGSYVIASTAAPLQLDSTGRFNIDEMPRVFVFDSSNSLAYYRGYQAPVSGPPLDRATWTVSANITSSSVNSAKDGNVSSRWTTGAAVSPGVTYFQIDMNAVLSIGAVRIDDTQFSADIPTKGDVYVSTDGVAFTLAKQWTVADIAGGILTPTWFPVSARYVKLVATETPAIATNWFSIGEINVYASIP